ncbi:hypothetical protein Pcinc_018119 [Petrolisthes cinctipes]|uniref:Uncharacterized protein n=1 Tax=Petrolisthes cinctipes TaxID=88211 RepID=A0AAE1FNR5_PETCI|nr:hypothetical protein Pcinc_018119 [Petrolisthes cinctipes]
MRLDHTRLKKSRRPIHTSPAQPSPTLTRRCAHGVVRCRDVMTAADLTLCSLPPGQRSHCHKLATVTLCRR